MVEQHDERRRQEGRCADWDDLIIVAVLD